MTRAFPRNCPIFDWPWWARCFSAEKLHNSMGGISLLFYSSSCGTLPVKQFLQSFTFLDDLFWRCEAFDFPLVAALVTEGFFEDLLLSPSARILAASRIVADDASESSCFSSYCLDTLVHQNENMI